MAGKSLPLEGFHCTSFGKRKNACQNVLVKGDNVEVLGLLQSTHKKKIRCVYIDPPYNNDEVYKHYSDCDNFDDWLTSVVDVVKLIRPLLTDNGSIWISIDDTQVHYLKVALDRVFGRENFVSTIIWQHRTTRENRNTFSNDHEYLLVYAKDASKFKNSRNLLSLSAEVRARYRNADNDPRGPWQSVSANVQDGHAVPSQFYEVVAPNGKRHRPPKGRCWAFSEARFKKEISAGNIYFGKDGNGVPRIKKFIEDGRSGLTPPTLWLAGEVGTTRSAKKELALALPDAEIFDTPKPTGLISRILEIATDPGDTVLDAYLGSGTTAVAAMSMGRHFLGIERGKQIVSHCVNRLRKVSKGDRQFCLHKHRT